MDDSEVRHAVDVLATAYRELAVLVDRAELEGLAGHGQKAHVLALRKACRDLRDFGEIVAALAEASGRQRLAQHGFEFEFPSKLRDRLRTADVVQLEAVLRTQEQLFREVGVDRDTAARLVEECRASLRPEPDRAGGVLRSRNLPDVFEELASETCRLAQVLEQSAVPEPEVDEKRRARARRVLRISLRVVAAAAGIGIGVLATPMIGAVAAAVLHEAATILFEEAASELVDQPQVQLQSVDLQDVDVTAADSEPSEHGTEQSRRSTENESGQEREAGA
jgi:hypothetical protein